MLAGSPAFSQDADFFNGQLVDAKTREPIAFATIRLKGYALGVISNEDGGFRVPEHFLDYGDMLKISSMGYQNKEIPMSALSHDVLNIISLEPGLLQLQETVVTAKDKNRISARRIVKKAIRQMSVNNPSNPFSTVGYYRDYQMRQGNYVNLNEALLEVFDGGFNSLDLDSTKVRLYQYRTNTDFERDSTASRAYDYKNHLKVIDKAYLASYGGNEFTILRIHDAIRNYNVKSYSFVNQFDKDFIQNHKLYRSLDTYSDGEYLFTIKFYKIYPDYSAYGTLYIGKEDFAIHKLDYAVYDGEKIVPNHKIDRNGTDKQLIYEILTEYKKVDGKMYPNYISLHNTFQVWDPPIFKTNFTSINFKEGNFDIQFNLEPDRQEASQVSNYKLLFKGQEIALDSVEVRKRTLSVAPYEFKEDKVSLYVKMKKIEKDKMFDELFAANWRGGEEELKKLLSIQAVNVRDKEGNLINEWTHRDFNQFREYFVQQVKPNNSAPADTLYMKKDIPIFKDQPIVKPKNFKDYWMNTPLKKSE